MNNIFEKNQYNVLVLRYIKIYYFYRFNNFLLKKRVSNNVVCETNV